MVPCATIAIFAHCRRSHERWHEEGTRDCRRDALSDHCDLWAFSARPARGRQRRFFAAFPNALGTLRAMTPRGAEAYWRAAGREFYDNSGSVALGGRPRRPHIGTEEGASYRPAWRPLSEVDLTP
mmetsp:Transcript_95238/g.238718  ORF Transcript_95238/g.238718 Transcript_95238/m.238718 type:complete len:125 (+) Transcript_95238:396-770(+)